MKHNTHAVQLYQCMSKKVCNPSWGCIACLIFSPVCAYMLSEMLICTHRGPQPRGVKYQPDKVGGISYQPRDPLSNCSSFSHLAGLSRGGVRESGCSCSLLGPPLPSSLSPVVFVHGAAQTCVTFEEHGVTYGFPLPPPPSPTCLLTDIVVSPRQLQCSSWNKAH